MLKLLLPYMDNTDPANYLYCVATKLSIEDNQKDQLLLPQLRQLVEYISNFGDRRRVLKKVGNLVEQYPSGCSILLNMMGEGIDDQLMCPKLGMSCFPISWIAHDDYTNIDLSSNLLKSLPAKLFHLTKLKKLDVSHNQLQSIPSPLNWDCPKLEILSLAANDLRNEQWKVLVSSKIFTPYGSTSTVPQDRVSIFNVCAPSLMKVDISRNVKLSLFPEWLCLLPSLTILDIRGNPLLHTIPPQLSLARHLCVIKLDAEYITSPSPSEVAMGTSAIMSYLRCRHRGSLPFRQIRVVILGEPATGKHSLYTSLIGSASPSHKAHMNIGKYDYPQKRFFGNDRPRVTFQVVCFTGAESSRHFLPQCFFTHRSIFLVLWKVTDSEEGLSRLKQQLCNIQARVPGSPVILVGTHADQNSTVTASNISLWEAKWLSSSASVKGMLPPIVDSILMNCKNKRDVEQLQQVLYKHALELKNPRTKKLFINEMVPRSYVELQSLIQAEVKIIYTLKEGIPVKRRDHFINFVKEHTFPNTTEDDRELDAACRFLHDVGVIVHYNVYELNDIFFLDPQWLYNILSTIIDPVNTSQGVLRVAEITSLLKELGVARLQHHLFIITELFNIAVCLDMEREKFLIPSLLNSQRPDTYPSYDLLSSDVNCKHFCFGYLPNGFSAKLVAQVLLHIKQVLAQLMACRNEDIPAKPVVLVGGNEITEVTKDCTEYVIDFLTGYVMKDDSVSVDLMRSENSELKRKLLTLGTLPRSPARERKILTLTRPMATAKINHHSSHGDLLLSWVYWQKGMYICFQDNTQLWLEPTAEGVAAVVSGDPLLRVKVLSYISNCIGMLCEEHYLGLAVTVENPCPSCIKCVLRKDDGACAINTSQSPRYSVTSEDLPFSPILESPNSINPPVISITHETPEGLLDGHGLQDALTNSSNIANLLIASISRPESTCTSPVPPDGALDEPVQQSDNDKKPSDEAVNSDTHYLFPLLMDPNKEAMPTLDDVRTGRVKMFTNTECVEKAMIDHVIKCESCEQQVSLKSVDPSALLEDYADRLLVDPNLVQCDMESEELGAGSYAKVTNQPFCW